MDPEEAGRLVTAAADGDQGAWKALVERFSGLVWSVTRGYRLGSADAADVFQTAWLRLAEHLGRIEHPERIGAWLATTARHEALRIARSTARLVPVDDVTLLAFGQADENSPEQAVLDTEQAVLDTVGSIGPTRARCLQQLRNVLVRDDVSESASSAHNKEK